MKKGEKSDAVDDEAKEWQRRRSKESDPFIAPGFVWILTLKPPDSIVKRMSISI